MTVKVVNEHLDKVRLFIPSVTLFSPYSKAKAEDIRAAKGVSLEPDAVLTLGSQKVFDPKRLLVLQRLKDSLHRVFLKYGTTWLKAGYAVPDCRADDACREADEIIAEGNDEKAKIVANYDGWLKAFADANPEWTAQIKAKARSKAYVDDRIQFGYHVVRVSAARDDGPLADGLAGQVGGLVGSLLGDIAYAADKLLKDSLSGKEKVTRKALRPLKAARDKLLGFTFLDPRVQALADMIDAVTAALPADGPIEGANLSMLWGITGILADPTKAMAVADSFQSDGASAFLATIKPQQPTLASVPPAVHLPVASAGITPVAPALQLGVGGLGVLPGSLPGMRVPLPSGLPQQSLAGLFGAGR